MLRKEEVVDWLDVNQLDPSLVDLNETTAAQRPLGVIKKIGNWLLGNFQYPCSSEAVIVWAHWHAAAQHPAGKPLDKA